MRTSTKDQRLRLFRRGNTRCPICFAEFNESAVRLGKTVTIEHAPPRSLQKELGLPSRALCLTCSRCNNMAGEQADRAALMALKPVKAHVQIGSVSCNADITLHEGGATDFDIVTKSSSGRIDYQNLGAADCRVTFKLPNPNFVNASWLKSGYLSVFSLLGTHGYRYAEGSATQEVREQIMNPKEEIIKYVPFTEATGQSSDWISIGAVNGRPCWIVSFGSYVTMLPASWDTDFYKDDAFSVGNEVKISGEGYHWKRRKFGYNGAGSFTPDDKEAFEKIVGHPTLGDQIRITNREGGEVEHFVLADYRDGVITKLRVRPRT